MKSMRILMLLLPMLLPLWLSAVILPDSLLNQLEGIHDSSKVKILNQFVAKNYRSNPEICNQALKQALELAPHLADSSHLARSYSLAGVLAKNTGNYSLALENQYKSLQINKILNDREGMASNYNDIGIVHKTLKQYDKALESYHLANALAVELDMKRGIIMTLNNIGTIYEAKENFEDAVEYYNMAYKKAVEYQILDAQAIILNNLGEIFASKGDNLAAIDYFKRTLEIDQKTGDKIGSVYSMINVAAALTGAKAFSEASSYFEQAKTTASELKANQLLLSIFLGMSELYEQQQSYQKALIYHQMAMQYQDSLFSETKQKQLADAEARFEASKKDSEIQLLKQEQMIKQIEIEQHKAERMALISLLIMGSIIVVYLYKRNQNKQIQQFNAQLIAQKENHLRAVVDAQEDERKRIAKDLHDSIGQTLAGVKLGLSSLKNNTEIGDELQGKLSELANVVDHTAQEIRSISHQMMPRMLQEDGLVPAISDMLEKTFRYSSIQYAFEHFGLDLRLNEKVEISIFRIVQELINNIVKHSGADHVNVQLLKNANVLILLVEDNGKGFDMNNGSDKGIGLLNITSRVKTIHGEFNLEPSPGSGTLATIRIPLDQLS